MAFGDSIGLLFKIRADSKDAQDELKKLRKAFDDETKNVLTVRDRFQALGRQVGLTDSQMASLAKTAPMVGAAVGVAGGAAIAAGAAIFALTKRASDAGSEIYEFSQRTNLSAEFLSVLKVQAEQSGSSLESSAGKATKFANSLVDAARGNDELIKLLKRFGIDAAQAYRNPEAALRKFIEEFNKLPPSAANNEAAMRLFKDRSGELIPVLRSMGTDIDGLMRKLDASGQIWTQEGTEKADEFGDALTELGQTATGIGNVFAREVMPDITSAMKDITKSVVENKDAFREWGKSVGDIIRGVRTIADSQLGAIVGRVAQVAFALSPVGMVVNGVRQLGAEAGDAAAIKNFGPLGARGVETPLTKGTPGAAPLAAGDVVDEAAAKEAARKREQARKEELRQIEAIEDAKARAYKRTIDAVRDAERDVLREIEEAKKRNEQLDREAADRRIDASEAVRDVLRAELAIITEENTHLTAINDTIRRAEILGAIDARTAAFARQLAVVNELAKVAPGSDVLGGAAEALGVVAMPQGAGPMVTGAGAAPEAPFSGDIFQEWGQKVGEVFGVVGEQARGVGAIINDSFGMMANAAGSAIKAFVLFGSAGGSFRKFAAEVVASIASMAIVQAVWEAAQGLAMLALTWFTGNPKYAKSAAGHFAAAAMYGTIGGVAAVAGRALAGNSFASDGGGGGGYGGSGAADEREDYRTRYMREQGEKERYTQREDRRSESTIVQLVVDGRELGRAVLNHVRDGGDLRDGFRNSLGVAG